MLARESSDPNIFGRQRCAGFFKLAANRRIVHGRFFDDRKQIPESATTREPRLILTLAPRSSDAEATLSRASKGSSLKQPRQSACSHGALSPCLRPTNLRQGCGSPRQSGAATNFA